MLATITCSVMVSITAIQIPTTSTTTVKTMTMSKKLIQRTILIMSSYVIIANAIKVLVLFKNMVNLLYILFNSFNNPTQISTKENSKKLMSELKT